MKQVNSPQNPVVFTSLLYVIGFVLFLEWLYPINKITETDGMTYFIMYAVFCFLISFFQLKWWQSFILKALSLFFVLHVLYFSAVPFIDLTWINALLADTSYNMELLFSGDLYQFTTLFRSESFLILIWLMSYLIHFWFVIAKRISLFVLMTIVYLSVLDTFTDYDAILPIMRVFIFSLVALGMTNFMKRVIYERVPFSWWKKSARWFLPIIVIVLLASLIGYGAPKMNPQWPDPMPFFRSLTGTDGNDSTKKVGYGEDDTQLGGSFEQDETRVFEAISKTNNYWRIETKDTYTGKGWESDSEEKTTHEVDSLSDIPVSTFSENVETEPFEATVKMDPNAALPKLVYPYGITGVKIDQDVQLLHNVETDSLRTTYADEDVHIPHYTLEYEEPSFDLEELKKDNNDPEEIKEKYTQIPNNLPERVKKLAEDITESSSNRYEKALAIEQHFGKSNEFTYETKNIPVPKGNTDYVDQFLFESKKGYCDNYSTSMVVMLRTLGIPARWAKGFTSGEDITSDTNEDMLAEDYHLYEVSNANAHSWPEVYFSEVGWVPFEPTQGFDNLADFHEEIGVEGEEEEEVETDEAEPEETIPEDPAEEEVEEQQAQENETSSDDASSFQVKPWHMIVAGSFIIILLAFLYRKRLSIQAYFIGKKLKENQDEASVQKAYLFLLKVLQTQGDGKKAHQTLREYAQYIDRNYSTHTMVTLTSEYEQILYNNQGKLQDSSKFIRLWKEFVHEIIS